MKHLPIKIFNYLLFSLSLLFKYRKVIKSSAKMEFLCKSKLTINIFKKSVINKIERLLSKNSPTSTLPKETLFTLYESWKSIDESFVRKFLMKYFMACLIKIFSSLKFFFARLNV